MYKLEKDFLNPEKIKDINSYKWLAQPIDWPKDKFEQYIDNKWEPIERNLNFNMIPENIAKILLWNNEESDTGKNKSDHIFISNMLNHIIITKNLIPIYQKITRKWVVRIIKK